MIPKGRSRIPILGRLFRTLSLRVQVAILLALAMLPVGILALDQGIHNYTETKRLRQESFVLEALQAGEMEQAAINEAFGAMGVLKAQIESGSPRRLCRTVFKEYTNRKPGIAFIGFIDTTGKLDCSVPEADDAISYSGSPEFTSFMQLPRPAVTARDVGDVSRKQVLVLTEPIYRDGSVAGALVMSISSRYLAWVARKKETSPLARYTLVARDNLNIARSQDTDADWLPPAPVLGTLLIERDHVVEATSRDGKERVFAIAPLFEGDVFAVASWRDESSVMSMDIRSLLLIALPVLMWALAIPVAYIAVDRLALRHIVYLDRLVGVYGRSGRHLRASAMRDAPMEIAKLGESFDAMVQDIETREAVLTDALDEKEILLREINHRVKNNLQMVSSLTSLQIRDATTRHERMALERLQERIHGLSAVHHSIYEAENMNEIRVDHLIAGIARKLADSNRTSERQIELDLDLKPVSTGPDKAMPLTLFATEAIVNAFKHGLSNAPTEILRITLTCQDDTLRLDIINGLPETRPEPDADAPMGKGIGQKLSDGFVAQLRGNVERVEAEGLYRVTLTVPHSEQGDTPEA
jgi:two-component sensor histidine kinase